MTNQTQAVESLKLFNTLHNGIEEIVPKTPGELKFYACGPTVYSFAHIGNFRSFLSADLLIRTARARGYKVTFVCNITDVGHLAGDDVADSQGEDKMARALRSNEGKAFANIWDLARFYADSMIEDWRKLGLSEPDVRPRAAEHVTEQLELIDRLHRKGFAYEPAMGVYFDVSKFPRYGALSGNTVDQVRDVTRDLITDPEKRSQQDFALWKKDEAHLMRWHSPYGWGFPGWHIECSAMAMRYLGNSFDIHSGGEDNRFPHHECEIAQSEAATGQQYVSYWMHTAHLLVGGRKMAKSSGNFFTVRDILGKGIDPLALRYALTCARYRDQLNFTEAALEAAVRVRERIDNCYREIKKRAAQEPSGAVAVPDYLAQAWQACVMAMADDLNTPEAYAALMGGIRAINSNLAALNPAEVRGCAEWFEKINGLTGLVYSEYEEQNAAAPDAQSDDWIRAEIDARNQARANKDFKAADVIRDRLKAAGIELLDTPAGTDWKVIKG